MKPAAPLAYDTAAYELAPAFPNDGSPWSPVDAERELTRRIARQKARHEIDVYYYRIGHTLAFPLSVARRPARADLPPGIESMAYPWMIWLSWELEERWRTLHHAWRQRGDAAAGTLLQRELAALAGWDRIIENNDQPGLATAHIAGCLAQALADERGWEPDALRQARAAADALIERDVWPWFQKQWAKDQPYDHRRLVNIPVITLARAAQLARVIQHERTAAMERRMIEVLQTWARFRTGGQHHTEGTTYDGYLMDSVTDWMRGLPDNAALAADSRDAFRSLVEQWVHLTLPGRADLHAPIGDVEPEMMFWATVVGRASTWYRLGEGNWLLTRVNLSRLPVAAVVEAVQPGAFATPPIAPKAAAREHPHIVSLRSGWTARDAAAFVSVSRNPMSHLHAEAGQVVVGWEGRFWITDPGYQQYRPGDEREYTIGVEAHNAPVIDGLVQKPHAAVVEAVETRRNAVQYTRVGLTPCYPGLPTGSAVTREVWFASGPDHVVAVRDSFAGTRATSAIATRWLGGTHLAWAFVDGWVRLSDGERAVWLGRAGGRFEPAALIRHPGTRGPLTITHTAQGILDAQWWVIWCDPKGGWAPPQIAPRGEALDVRLPNAAQSTLSFSR